MIRCAVTGHTGVLGSKIIKNLPFQFYKFKGDITKFKEVNTWVKAKNFDIFIHLAAIVPTNEVKHNYKKAYKVNYLGTKNLIKSINQKKIKPKWFFFSSTSHVYKLTCNLKKRNEKSKIFPSTLYGKTKLFAEKELIKNFTNNYPKLCIGRIFSFTDVKQKKAFVVPSIIFKIKNSKSKIVKFNNLNHFRDFISVSDIVKIIYKLYKLEKKGIFNLGSGKKINLKDIARYVAKKYNKEVNFVDNEKITYLISNNKKIKKIYKKKLSNPFK